MKTIRHCDVGIEVEAAKLLTKYATPEEKTALTVYEAEFTAYVSSWQRRRGLTPDGVIGPVTWARIASEAPTCAVGRNRTGAWVYALQLLLGGLDTDGIFGAKTRAAVLAWQAARGLQADGICGPKTWTALLTGAELHAEISEDDAQPGRWLNDCVHYLQWDARWKKIRYSTHTSSQTIGNSGCGPTAMAMILATWIDKQITPVEMCELAVETGCRTYNSGTSWDFYPIVFRRYEGFAQYISTASVETLKEALKQGALAVCSMNSGDNGFWTTGGHFITVIGCDAEGYIYANDPNKSAAPRKQQEKKFAQCLKQAFIFWRREEAKSDGGALSSPSATLPYCGGESFGYAGDKIVDVSKWDYPVDFDQLRGDAGLVIARAASGSDPDPKFGGYAALMQERQMPFGVYGYSYAATASKARDEAEKLYSYASVYEPLFWVYDVEESRNTRAAVLAWVERMRALGAKKIGIYLGKEIYDRLDIDGIRGLFDFVWYARYGKNDGLVPGKQYEPHYPCDLWQYTSRGRIAGIDGDVDLNVITGEGHDLTWFCGGDED